MSFIDPSLGSKLELRYDANGRYYHLTPLPYREDGTVNFYREPANLLSQASEI